MEYRPEIQTSDSAEQLAELTYKILDSCHRKEEVRVKEYHLTQAEFRCLRLIHENESINSKIVAVRMGLSPSRCTRIINGLVVKGFVDRQEEPNDRRNMRLTLTPSGYEFLKYVHTQYIDLHKEVLSALNPQEKAGVLQAMVNLFSRIDNWLTAGHHESTVA
ncbi:MAG: MarR family transcriptional regulator [Ignavibacteriaceae bacterium]|nr:MarR family transcriptional regulator [Ignavibacteriaceae bacterium]